MRNGGAAPDPSTQFSLFRLYMIEHPTFHSAQDDEMRRRILIALRVVVISSVAERSSLQNGQCTNCAISITACSSVYIKFHGASKFDAPYLHS